MFSQIRHAKKTKPETVFGAQYAHVVQTQMMQGTDAYHWILRLLLTVPDVMQKIVELGSIEWRRQYGEKLQLYVSHLVWPHTTYH
jgi:hypothetical protein